MAIAVMILIVLAVIVLIGMAGLVLLVVGIIKRSTLMWGCGIIGIGLAGLALLAGVAVGLYLGMRARGAASSSVVQASPGGGGDYVRFSDGRATARVEGVEFTVLGPGSGGASSSVRTKSGVLPGTSETRHEVRFGDVTIVVEKRDSQLILSVNGTDYGPVQRGDAVLINEARDVLINGQRPSR
jgi:hypothetical protein